MTRQEAIAFGQQVIDLGLNDDTHKFCEIAIEALSQEPCEDAISREEALLCCTGQVDIGATFEDAIAMITKRLKKLPSVTPITVRSECEDAISRAEVNAIIDDIIAENEAHEARISWHDNEAPRKYETSERCERVNPNNPAKNTAMKYGYIADGAEKVKKRIANLSSVTPIRPKGNWVKVDGDESVSLDEYKCSCCGGIHSVLSDWKYCPNCGAEMKGEE